MNFYQVMERFCDVQPVKSAAVLIYTFSRQITPKQVAIRQKGRI